MFHVEHGDGMRSWNIGVLRCSTWNMGDCRAGWAPGAFRRGMLGLLSLG